MNAEQKKQAFIKALAKFLAGDQGGKSIALQMEKDRVDGDPRPKLAHEWADLLNAAGFRGYASVEDAEKLLIELLK